ncbi:MAG: hypothetical protein RLZZ126_1359 [Pseudomonadota bacterium]
MTFVRGLLLVLLVGAALSFLAFIFTGRVHHKQRGLLILKWTLVAAFGFFAVLVADNLLGKP